MSNDSSIVTLVENLNDFLHEHANDRYTVWEVTDDHIILTDNYDASNLEIRVEESG